MQQFLDVWNALDIRKRVVVIGSALIVMFGVLFLTRAAVEPDLALLYSGLPLTSAGEVIAQLEGEGVPFEVQAGAIFVDATQRDQLRLKLASQGLPTNGGDGYELLDGLSGFGTTSQMFDAAYLRAKEGELARTIVANPQVSSARVHIAKAEKNPFRQSVAPTASVSVRGDGSAISDGTAEAIRFLVASAVAGLQPVDVSVINADLGVVMSQGGDTTPAAATQMHAERLKQNVERIIMARTGFNGAVVEVNVDTLTDEETIIERKIDPDSRVAISTNTQETSSTSRNQGGQAITVASNLPEGEGQGGEESSDQNTETREVVNYEISETTREMKRVAGSIKRVTVAVLVDGSREVNEEGQEVWLPRGDEELAALEQLVKSAIGFDEARGDSVTLRSMDLSLDPATVETPENGWVTERPLDVMGLSKVGIAAGVILVLGLFVLRPILTNPKLNTVPQPSLLPIPQDGPVLTGEIEDRTAFNKVGTLPSPEGLSKGVNNPGNDQSDDPVQRLKSLIDERQDETVEVLKSWIEAPEVTAE